MTGVITGLRRVWEGVPFVNPPVAPSMVLTGDGTLQAFHSSQVRQLQAFGD